MKKKKNNNSEKKKSNIYIYIHKYDKPFNYFNDCYILESMHMQNISNHTNF